MKILIVLVLSILISPSCYAQYSYYGGYYNPNVAMNNIGMGLQGILQNNYASSAQQGAMYGQAATINAQGNYLLNQSMANINNEMAYSMSLHNQTLRARTFFEKRQINGYYRDMEAWQREERSRLKRSGLYDKESIEYLYDIRRP